MESEKQNCLCTSLAGERDFNAFAKSPQLLKNVFGLKNRAVTLMG